MRIPEMISFKRSKSNKNTSMFLALLASLAPAVIRCFVLTTPYQNTITMRGESTTSLGAFVVEPSTEMIQEGKNLIPKIISEMPEPIPSDLKNKYYFLRHGQSTANVAEIISSSRSLAYSTKHGLTQFGYEQGKESAENLLDVLETDGDIKSGDKVIFVSSPFARAKETSEACLDGLVESKQQERISNMGIEISNDIKLENRLMERYFGKLDAEAIYTYAYVWPLDKFNVTHTAFDVESVAAVCTRVRDVVSELEEEYDGCHLVLVSHADVLQIAQLYAANVDNVGVFSSYRFKNGEVRAMKRTPDSLPPPSDLEAPQRGTRPPPPPL